MTNSTKTRANAAREARLRAALRENLKRRKAQARGRAQDDSEPDEAESVNPPATSGKPEG
jgi:hypothetical protein